MKQAFINHSQKLGTLLLSFLLFCSLATPLTALAVEEDSRTVRIPCDINAFLYHNEEGQLVGVCKEYLDALAKVNNWRYEYIPCTWPKAVSMLESGELDLLFPTNYSREREDTMEFSNLFGGYTAPGLFARADADYHFEDYASFDGARIAVTENSSNHAALSAFAESRGFRYEPVFLSSTEEKIEALQTGAADIMVFTSANLIPDCVLVSVLDAEPFYYAVRKGNEALLNELNNGMQEILRYSPDLVSDTSRRCFFGEGSTALALTRQEREFVTSGESVVVGFYQDTPPLAYVNQDGSFDGIYLDLLREIETLSGIKMQLEPINQSQDWRDLLAGGDVDFYIGASADITAGMGQFQTSHHLVGYQNVLITRSTSTFQPNEPSTIALTYGRSYWADYLPDSLGIVNIRYYQSAKDCLAAVVRGQADGALLNNLEFNYHSKNARFSDLIQWENYRYPSGATIVAGDSASPTAFSIINKVIDALPNDLMQNTLDEYISMPYISTTFSDVLYTYRRILMPVVFLSTLSLVFGGIFVSIRKKQRQQDRERELDERRQISILAALSQDYEFIYHVDLNHDRGRIIYLSPSLQLQPERIPKINVYSQAISIYITQCVIAQDQNKLEPLCDVQEVKMRLHREQQFILRYQTNPNTRNQEFFEMHFVNVSDDDTPCEMVLGIRCVDALVRAERTQRHLLQDALNAADQANAAKSDFLSKMSHDIRTPMNAILGMTAIAEAHINDINRVRDSLHKITAAGKHLLSLINEVLDMSRIESGRMTLSHEAFSLSDLLNNLLTMVRPDLEQHHHSFQTSIRDVEHENVIGDTLRLQQIFINLMSNAIKYTPDGGEITLSVHELPTYKARTARYEFVITDSGIGMSEEFLTHIFEPFARAEDVRISKVQGTGLGMPIVKNLVNMMGGTITVESELNKGSTFRFIIMLQLQEEEEEEEEEEEKKLTDRRVLVVDDNIDACESLCTLLRQLGVHGESCQSGEECLTRLTLGLQEGDPFYAVIVDWRMPGFSGLETAHAIRNVVGSNIHVIITSAHDWSDIELEARAAGVGAFLSKPVFKSSLIRAFKQLHPVYGTHTEVGGALDAVKSHDFTGHRILLVEDNELNREIAKEILESTGLTVDEAENGQIAVDTFDASPVDYYNMILMDIQMPVMNGNQAAMAIRSLPRQDAGKVPIVAMTANAFTEDIQASRAASMNEHLAKPVDFEKLSAILQKYLR